MGPDPVEELTPKCLYDNQGPRGTGESNAASVLPVPSAAEFLQPSTPAYLASERTTELTRSYSLLEAEHQSVPVGFSKNQQQIKLTGLLTDAAHISSNNYPIR